MDILEQIAQFLADGDEEKTAELTEAAIGQGLTPRLILDRGLIAGMDITGKKFRDQEVFLPEVLLSARAMQMAMEKLKPLLLKDALPSRGKVVLGTVQGDLHDIGKNLVAIMLRGSGYEVIDLGTDVPAERFIATAIKEKASVIGVSALLTTTIPLMRQVKELHRKEGLDGKIKFLIGGAPVSEKYAEEIGADGYGCDAVQAVEWVEKNVKKGEPA